MNYKTIFVLLTLSITTGLIGIVYATNHGTIDQSFTGPLTSTGTIPVVGEAYQTFTPTVNNLVAVDIYLINKDKSDYTGTFQLYVKSPIIPPSSVTKTVTLPASSITPVRFELVSPLDPGNIHKLSLFTTSDRFVGGWAYNPDPRSYLGGEGATTDGITGDFGFTTYYEASPKQQTQAIIDVINDLVNSGDLNKGNGNALVNKLDTAIQQMANGDNATAINLLNAFINQVNAFVSSRTLTPEEGQQLIDAARSVIQGLH